MKIRILNVGRVRQKFVLEGEHEYLGRFSSDWKVKVEELALSNATSLSPKETLRKEAELTLKQFKKDECVILLDEVGEQLTSAGLADFIRDAMLHSVRGLCFLIGGAYGVDKSVRDRADRVISLSKLTYPHQLVRLMLVEQVYRAYANIKSIPYGK